MRWMKPKWLIGAGFLGWGSTTIRLIQAQNDYALVAAMVAGVMLYSWMVVD